MSGASGVVLQEARGPRILHLHSGRIFNDPIGLPNEQHHESIIMPSPRWQRGESGNPAGRQRGSRNRLSEEVVCALLRDFRKHGEKAIAEVRRTQPGVYLKVLALLVPKEHRVEHSNALSGLSDEMLADMIAELEERVASRLKGENAKVIDAHAESALPPPDEPAGGRLTEAPAPEQPRATGLCPRVHAQAPRDGESCKAG